MEFAVAENASANPSIMVITVTKRTVHFFHLKHNARRMQIRLVLQDLICSDVNIMFRLQVETWFVILTINMKVLLY